jgi:hypothetical protein
MKTCSLLFLAAGMFVFSNTVAQLYIPGSFDFPESLMESMASMGNDPGDMETVLNDLDALRKKPLDLNSADKDDLERLVFLTDFQIESLLKYRETNGKLLSIYELQVIYGFTPEVIQWMLPFVTIHEQVSKDDFSRQKVSSIGNQEVSIRGQRIIQNPAGYSVYDSSAQKMHYPGNPWLMNIRFEYEFKDQLRAGFTAEKDPGEEFFRASNRNGFDFLSAYAMLEKAGPLKTIVVGDYRLAFGQGLTLWNGGAPGKSSMPMGIVKRQDAVKAFTSNDENNFFRGVAASSVLGRFTLTAFCSSVKKDANITDTTLSGHINFSSFQESGYHRTSAEIADENSVRETAFGANLLYRNNTVKIGSTLVNYRFDKYMEAGNDLKDLYDFTGNNLLNWGIDYLVTLKNIQLFGETSLGNEFWATLHGMLCRVNKYASFSFLFRNLGKGYYSLHSAAFSEGSTDSNERGLYAGLVIYPVSGIKISGYADFYKFPWLKTGLSAPASGSDYLLQADYNPVKNLSMYLRFKYENEPENAGLLPDSVLIPELAEQEHTGFRYHISYKLGERLMMQNRFEMSVAGSARGYMVYHDMAYSHHKLPLTLDFRLAWFKTDNYDSRIYAYEQDMTTGYSFSPLYDEGYRTYLMGTVELLKKLRFSTRLSETFYTKKDFIGSGSDKISSSSRTDLKFLLTMHF